MAIFTAYFDASGAYHDKAVPVLTVAGYISTDEKWARFEGEWQAVLDAEGVSCLHMKDFAPSRGEFKNWKDDSQRRASFLEKLSGLIGKHTEHYFSQNLLLEDYRKVDRRFKLYEFAPPYILGAQFVVGEVKKWMKEK